MTTLDGKVGCVLPNDYPAYARIFHRINPGDRAIRWSQVCQASGATAHPLMQWHLICRGWADHSGIDPLSGRSSDVDPEQGNLDPISVAALYAVLRRATVGSPTFHAFWVGWGGLHRESVTVFDFVDRGRSHAPADADLPFPPSIVDGPELRLPGREYLVFTGALDPSLFERRTGSTFWPQSPNLSWPADRSWCIATEVDFDSTLIGGSHDLIDAVLASADLEAMPVTASDKLTFDADLINNP